MSGYRESYAYLADGRPIYFYEEGAGPPLLLIHGGAADADAMRPMTEVLRDRFRCIALDRVGYRRLGSLDRVTTVEEQVEAISAVHRFHTSRAAWVFGHSAAPTRAHHARCRRIWQADLHQAATPSAQRLEKATRGLGLRLKAGPHARHSPRLDLDVPPRLEGDDGQGV